MHWFAQENMELVHMVTDETLAEGRLGGRRAVATLLGRSVDTVKRWEKSGTLPEPVRLTPKGHPLHDLGRIRDLVAEKGNGSEKAKR